MTAHASERPGPGSRVVEVVGEHAGQEVVRRALAHGSSPELTLDAAGWASRGPVREVRSEVTGGVHRLTLRYDVRQSEEPAGRGRAAAAAPAHPELRLAAGEVPVAVQRVAAYALVTSERGLLLTEFSELTAAPGSWGLPGGGIDPGEDPAVAVVREVLEETGQAVVGVVVAGVVTTHFVGRSPIGRAEDFHGVRLLYHAECPEPTDPVVHDVGGTTSDARWVPFGELSSVRLTPGWRAAVDGLLDLTA